MTESEAPKPAPAARPDVGPVFKEVIATQHDKPRPER